MIRRIALLAGALALVACNDSFKLPTDVTRQVIDGETAEPPDQLCTGERGAVINHTLIPWCVDAPVWPDDLLKRRG